MAEFVFEGKKVYYEIHGEKGEPFLVLNGIMMSTASWKPFIPDFSRNNVAILVDFFDQGQSERMTEKYDHDIQVRLLRALIDELPYERVSVMGISYGGEIAVQLAVSIKLFSATLCHILEHRRTERKIGNKHPIHNINVQPLGLTAVNHIKVTLQVCKICRQQRRRHNLAHIYCFLFLGY